MLKCLQSYIKFAPSFANFTAKLFCRNAVPKTSDIEKVFRCLLSFSNFSKQSVSRFSTFFASAQNFEVELSS